MNFSKRILKPRIAFAFFRQYDYRSLFVHELTVYYTYSRQCSIVMTHLQHAKKQISHSWKTKVTTGTMR